MVNTLASYFQLLIPIHNQCPREYYFVVRNKLSLLLAREERSSCVMAGPVCSSKYMQYNVACQMSSCTVN
jgi:hypothetical protein